LCQQRGQRKGTGTMGLLDKVKDAAQNATVAAKDAAAKGQAKLDGAQAKRAADGLLRDLGAAYYATKTGRSTATTDADIDRLVAALQAHESEHGQITLAPESAAANPTAVPADGSTPAPPPAAADPASPPPPPPAAADPASPPPPPPTAQTL
jgi:hypothetical protein